MLCLTPVVHRDISNKNVLRNSELEVVHVSDFGTARLLRPNSSKWTSFAGTLGYAALELAYSMEANQSCDVYSFGVLAFEIILGRYPGDLVLSLSSSTSSP
ncbi:hypothetical protein RJ639_047754 [Escallonia herrerae]|uniref:non-specific serine/threonine protein kinase n=1 Tax=Escallonia herrerae TaxID=1293975 RepID=A0AA88W751_9ASTE|nr:hypothetical protein RJ639_047754 [Escallonia herrerae]